MRRKTKNISMLPLLKKSFSYRVIRAFLLVLILVGLLYFSIFQAGYNMLEKEISTSLYTKTSFLINTLEEEISRIRVAENEYLVEGSMKLNDLNDIIGTELESEDYDSIGGYLTGLFEHLPNQGESIQQGGLRFVIEAANDTRVEKVRIFKLDESLSP